MLISKSPTTYGLTPSFHQQRNKRRNTHSVPQCKKKKKKGQEVKNKTVHGLPKRSHDKTNRVQLPSSLLLSSLGKDTGNKVDSAIGAGLPVMILDVTCETRGCSYLHFVNNCFVDVPTKGTQQFRGGRFGSEQCQSFLLLLLHLGCCWTLGLHEFPERTKIVHTLSYKHDLEFLPEKKSFQRGPIMKSYMCVSLCIFANLGV